MNKLRIVVDFAAPPGALERLRQATQAHQLVFPPGHGSSTQSQAELAAQFATADIVFGQPDPRAIAQAADLKWIQISSSGITRYDNPQFRALMAERKITVTNSASVYNEPTALHAFSFMLAQARNLPAARQTRTANDTQAWHALRGSTRTLREETVLLLGYGAIGRRLAELLRPLGMNVLAYRRKARGDEAVPIITGQQLADALRTADHVVDILPDSGETRHFCNSARFADFKRGAIFYNVGRGTTVDQAALLAALRSGHIGAAWLDVTEPEPLPDEHPLWAEPNCFITPHIAGGHAGEAETLVRHFLKNLDLFVRGTPLRDRVM